LFKETDTSSTNQSSSFPTQELFEEAGYTSDVTSMAGFSRIGFWMSLSIIEPG